MSKSKRKWIQLDWSKSGALRAQDIPYDSTTSIKTKIDDIESNSGETTYLAGYTEIISEFTSSDNKYYVDVNHNLGTKYIVCQVYDSTTSYMIVPYDIDSSDDMTSRIWFEENPGTIEVVILSSSGAGPSGSINTISNYTQDGDLYYATINHGLDTTSAVVVVCYNSSTHLQVVPADIKIIDSDSIRLWFDNNSNNIDVLILEKGSIQSGSSSSLIVKEVGNSTSYTTTTLEFDGDTGFVVEDQGSGVTKVSLGSHWKNIIVDGQTTLTPSGEETLEFESGFGINITTNATTTPKKITIASEGKVKSESDDSSPGYLSDKINNSLEISSEKIQLKNDSDSPGNEQYYGTDNSGTKGYHSLPPGGCSNTLNDISNAGGNIDIVGGENVTVTANDTTNTITIDVPSFISVGTADSTSSTVIVSGIKNLEFNANDGFSVEQKSGDTAKVSFSNVAGYLEHFDYNDTTSGIITITHNLNSKFVIPSVYDSSSSIILCPVNLVDENNLEINLSSVYPFTGIWSCIVCKPSCNNQIGKTGEIIYFAADEPPSGYLECDGSAISRSAYYSLFSIIDVTFGGGDGTNTFNIPDLRGEFIRGWDNGRGVDTSRTFGSSQSDDLKSHRHNMNNIWSAGSGSLNYAYMLSANRILKYRYTSYTGGTETRPRNIALLPCIKY